MKVLMTIYLNIKYERVIINSVPSVDIKLKMLKVKVNDKYHNG